jgi:hypothetical protein
MTCHLWDGGQSWGTRVPQRQAMVLLIAAQFCPNQYLPGSPGAVSPIGTMAVVGGGTYVLGSP